MHQCMVLFTNIHQHGNQQGSVSLFESNIYVILHQERQCYRAKLRGCGR